MRLIIIIIMIIIIIHLTRSPFRSSYYSTNTKLPGKTLCSIVPQANFHLRLKKIVGRELFEEETL